VRADAVSLPIQKTRSKLPPEIRRYDSGNATRGLINTHAVSAKLERRDDREPGATFERPISQNAEHLYRGVAAHDLSREVPKGGAARCAKNALQYDLAGRA